MTALEILKGLKRNPDCLLWINHDLEEAAYHNGDTAWLIDYQDAMLARSDPALSIIDKAEGEILSSRMIITPKSTN